jgi:hypothetical protein
MDSDNQNQYLFFGLVGLIVVSCWQLNRSWNSGEAQQARPQALEVSYDMPRPQAYSKPLDLSGREVKRTIEMPKTNREVNTAAIAISPNKVGMPMAQNLTKKTSPNKKKVAEKKQQLLQRRKLVIVSNTAAKKREKGLSRPPESQAQVQQAPFTPQVAEQAPEVETVPEKGKISAAQWKAFLFREPTSKNVNDFVTAFRRGDLNSDDFYKIVRDLLSNQDQELQSAALIVLTSDNSPQGFEMLVTLQGNVTEQTRSAMASLVEAYAQTTRFSALSRSLLSPIPEVAIEATRLLDLALSNAIEEENPRELRGLASGATPRSFQVFIPALQRLIATPESPLSGQAQALLEQIQSLLQNIG